MEADQLLTVFAATLEGIAWLGLAVTMLPCCPKIAGAGKSLLVGGLFSLCVVLLIAAFWHVPCAMTVGLTVMLLLLVIVHPPCREWHIDPYTLIYPTEEALA